MSEDSLGYAVFIGDLSRVRALLANGRNPDEPWGTGTPLLQVLDEPCEFFDESAFQIAEALLDAGAAVNASDADGHRPIHVASRSPSALALLIARGADTNAQTLDTGNSPLHCAVDAENVAGVELLLANDADRNVVNNDGQTPLDLALSAQAGFPSEFPSDELNTIVRLLRRA